MGHRDRMSKNSARRAAALLLALLLLAQPVLAAGRSPWDGSVITISSAEDLLELSRRCSLDAWSRGKTVVLTADISLSQADYAPIPTFGGTFDGGGHAITGLALSGTAVPAGLFAVLQEGAVVRDLTVGGSVSSTGRAGGAGGVAGENYGTIMNCSFSGAVAGQDGVGGVAGYNGLTGKLQNCTAAGSVTGKSRTGGIAGENDGVISSCRNGAYVNIASADPGLNLADLDLELSADLFTLQTLDTVNVATDTGGIAGLSSGMILSCTNTAAVGYPHIGYNVGGIAGRSCGYIRRCVNEGAVYGRKDIGGIVGQAEPYVVLNLTEDSLETLRAQLDQLEGLANRAAGDAEGASQSVSGILSAVGDCVDLAVGHGEDLKNGVSDYAGGILKEINRAGDILADALDQLSGLSGDVTGMSNQITGGIKRLEQAILQAAAAGALGGAVLGTLQDAVEAVREAGPLLDGGVEQIMDGMETLGGSVDLDGRAAQAAVDEMLDGFGDLREGLNRIYGALGTLLQALTQGVDGGGWDSALSDLDAAFQGIGAAMDQIESALTQMKRAFQVTDQEKADEAMDALRGGLSALWNALTDASAALGEISSALRGMDWGQASQPLQGLFDALAAVAGDLEEIIRNLRDNPGAAETAFHQLQEHWGGVTEQARALAEAMKGLNWDETQAPMEDLSAALEGVSAAMGQIGEGLVLLEQNTSFDEDTFRQSLLQLQTGVSTLVDALQGVGAGLSALGTLLKNLLPDSGAADAALTELDRALAAAGAALSRIDSGLRALLASASLDLDSLRGGLSEIADGVNTLRGVGGPIDRALEHLKDALGQTDTVSNQLKRAMETLAGAIGIFGDASDTGADILAGVEDLLNYLAGAGPIQFAYPGEDISAAAEGLTGALELAGEYLESLNGAVTDSTGQLSKDIRAISAQLGALMDTLLDAAYEVESGAEEETIADTSDADVDAATSGKLLSCYNTGTVSGDLCVGGVAGSMAVEVELDPEDDLSGGYPIRRRQYEAKAIAQKCVNTGEVTSRRDNAGGVCGLVDLGLVTACENYGTVQSESGDNVGGVAGSCAGAIRNSFVKCTLTGGEDVGGVAGRLESDGLIDQCYTLVRIPEYERYAGAVAGAGEGIFRGNRFVSDELAGVDRASETGRAEPISYEELLQAEGLPQSFRTLTLRFLAGDEVVKTVRFHYGDSFDESVFPDIPAQEGCFARWDTGTLTDLRFDTDVTAVYTPYLTALASQARREDGRPVFFAAGEFGDGDALTARQGDPAGAQALARTTPASARRVVELWELRVPEDGASEHQLRYLSPSGKSEGLELYVWADGDWEPLETGAAGSYLLAQASGAAVTLAVVSRAPVWWIWLLVLAVAAAAVLAVLWLVKRLRRRGQEKKEAVALRHEETPAESAGNNGGKRKTRRRVLLVVLCVLAAAAAACAAWFSLSGMRDMVSAGLLLRRYAREDALAMELELEGSVDGQDLSMSARVAQTDVEGRQVVRVEQYGAAVYYCDGFLYLENGQALALSGGGAEEGTTLWSAVRTLLQGADISVFENSGETITSITARGEDALALVGGVLPSAAGSLREMGSLDVDLIEKGGELSAIRLAADGVWGGETSADFSLSAQLTVLPDAGAPEIPQSVRDALAAGAPDAQTSGDLADLLSAWVKLNAQDPLRARLALRADCGPLVVDGELELYRTVAGGRSVSCVRKNGRSLYYSGGVLCGEDGGTLSVEEQGLAGSAGLLELAWQLCVGGGLRCTAREGSALYTLELDQEALKRAAYAILPAMEDLDVALTGGRVAVTVAGEGIESIHFTCEGSVRIVLADVPVTLSGQLALNDPSLDADFTVPDEVLQTFQGKGS